MLAQAIIQIVLSVVLTIIILLQGQASGLGSAFGGSSNYHTKRGMEKTLYIMTIVVLILFLGSTLFALI